jgi:serine/threonine-protein kinase
MSDLLRITERYQLDKLIHASDTANVFRATDTRRGRTVAVKLLRQAPDASPEGRSRFEAAAEALRGCHHPGLPALLDHGFTASAGAYLVFEYLSGAALDLLAGSPPARVLPLLAPVLGVLEELDRHHLAHRNVRAGNLLVIPAGNSEQAEQVKLLGWSNFTWGIGETGRRTDLSGFARLVCAALGGTIQGDSPAFVELPAAASELIADAPALTMLLSLLLEPTGPAPASLLGELRRSLAPVATGDDAGRTASPAGSAPAAEVRGDERSALRADVTMAVPRDVLFGAGTGGPRGETLPSFLPGDLVRPAAAVAALMEEPARPLTAGTAGAGVASLDDTRPAVGWPGGGAPAVPPPGAPLAVADATATTPAGGPPRGAGPFVIADHGVEAPASAPAAGDHVPAVATATPVSGEAPPVDRGTASGATASGATAATATTPAMATTSAMAATPAMAAGGEPPSGAGPAAAAGPALHAISAPATSDPGNLGSGGGPGRFGGGQPAAVAAPPAHPVAAAPHGRPAAAARSPAIGRHGRSVALACGAAGLLLALGALIVVPAWRGWRGPRGAAPAGRQTAARTADGGTRAATGGIVPPPAAGAMSGSGGAAGPGPGAAGPRAVIAGSSAGAASSTSAASSASAATGATAATGSPAPPAAAAAAPLDPRLKAAQELLLAGDEAGARRALGHFSAEQRAALGAADRESFDQLTVALAADRRARIAADLAAGQRRGDVRRLADALSAARHETALPPALRHDLDLARQAVDLDGRLSQAEKAQSAPDMLRQATDLLALVPRNARAGALRAQAAKTLEEQADAALAAGETDRAAALAGALRQSWPDRAGLPERGERIAAQRRTDERLEGALAAAGRAEAAGQPLAGLDALAGATAATSAAPGGGGLSPRFRDRFRQQRERLNQLLARLDAAPPSIALRPGYKLEYDKGERIAVPLRITDDLAVRTAECWVRPEGAAAYQAVPVRHLAGADYVADIPPEMHQNHPLDLYAMASDNSGHQSWLGTPDRPLKLKRRNWLEKILTGKEGG